MTTESVRHRCFAQALLPGGHWKTCIRDLGHTEVEPHVWLESFARTGGRPRLATWHGTRSSEPSISEVLLPEGIEPTP